MERKEKLLQKITTIVAFVISIIISAIYLVNSTNTFTSDFYDTSAKAIVIDQTNTLNNCSELELAIGKKYGCSPLVEIVTGISSKTEQYDYAIVEMQKYTVCTYKMVVFLTDDSPLGTTIILMDSKNNIRSLSDEKWITKFAKVATNDGVTEAKLSEAVQELVDYSYTKIVFDYVAEPLMILTFMYATLTFIFSFSVAFLLGKIFSVKVMRREKERRIHDMRSLVRG